VVPTALPRVLGLWLRQRWDGHTVAPPPHFILTGLRLISACVTLLTIRHASHAIRSSVNRVLLSTHADWQGVDISSTVCLFVRACVCVRIRISPPRMKLAASHFAWRFIQGRKSQILPIRPILGFWGSKVHKKFENVKCQFWLVKYFKKQILNTRHKDLNSI